MNDRRTRTLDAAAGIVAIFAVVLTTPVALAQQVSELPGPAAVSSPLPDLLLPEGAETGNSPLVTTSYRSWAVSAAGKATDSGLGYQYSGAGCLNLTGASSSNGDFDVDLTGFTTGDVITFFRVFYYDNSASNLLATLFEADAQGNYSIVAQVSSSGTPGYASAVDTPNWTVNEYTAALYARLTLNGVPDTSLQACRIRIGYIASLIFKDGFETANTSRWSAAVP